MVRVVYENVSKRFGDVVAVEDFSLGIKDKEFRVLLGPSGSGKTTLLNITAGLELADSGSVYFDDDPVDDVPPERRDVAMVFQSYALYPHMNAFDNIAFSLKIKKTPRDEVRKRVEETAGMLGISPLLKRKPYELSGGERQRVALARAIVRKPKVFLLDEPMSNVDAKLRVAMRAELIRLQKMLEVTMIYVTHDQVEAMTMADRIALMDLGRLIQDGEPTDLFERPANLFVAGFIGSPSMNFFDCDFKEVDGKGVLETASFSMELSRDITKIVKERSTGTALILGSRPQDITVYKEEAPKRIECEVYAVEPLGTETIVDLNLGDQVIKAVTSPTYMARIGDKAWITMDKDRMHILDKKTEKCII